MQIGTTQIGLEYPPYIIAEIGVNHDGQLGRALQLVDAAAGTGANAVKVQYFQAERLLGRAARLAEYQRAAGETDPVAMLARLELGLDALHRIVDHAHENKLHAIVTVFSVELVPPAAELAWDAFKSASPDIINRPLLEAMEATGRPLIISTGAAETDEVHLALASFGSAALHCVSAYPTPLDCAHLAGIAALRDLVSELEGPRCTSIAVGYSDHCASVDSGALAVAAGATILEKHLTRDRTATGPDHSASLELDQFARYVANALEAWHAMGPRWMVVQPIEQEVRKTSRQSLTALRDLPVGHRLQPEDVTIKRPGTGIAPGELTRIKGRTIKRAVPADMLITEDDLEPISENEP